jgi:hypothetical protein
MVPIMVHVYHGILLPTVVCHSFPIDAFSMVLIVTWYHSMIRTDFRDDYRSVPSVWAYPPVQHLVVDDVVLEYHGTKWY